MEAFFRRPGALHDIQVTEGVEIPNDSIAHESHRVEDKENQSPITVKEDNDVVIPSKRTGRPRGRSMLDEFANAVSQQSPKTTPSTNTNDTARATTINFAESPSITPSHLNRTNSLSHMRSSRYPLLQTTLDELSEWGSPLATRSPSLTSLSVVSNEDNRDFTDIPSASPSQYQALRSLQNSYRANRSVWPSGKEDGESPAQVEKFTRIQSLSILTDLGRRRSIRRTASTANTPASAFLKRYSISSEAPSEPDGESSIIKGYTLGPQIGYGGFSIIRKAFPKDHEKDVCAVKIVRRTVPGAGTEASEDLQAEVQHEIDVWKDLKHENVLPLLDYHVTESATFMFMPYLSRGTLFDLVRANRNGLQLDAVKNYTRQVVSAIHYLHDTVGLVHHDIKLENCLLDNESSQSFDRVLLCDFGVAQKVTSPDSSRIHRAFGPSVTSTNIFGTGVPGSLAYAAPELVRFHTDSTNRTEKISSHPSSDIWALGVMVYALASGDLPFKHSLHAKLADMIMKGDWNEDVLRTHLNCTFIGIDEDVEALVGLVGGCLDRDVQTRWSAARILGCAFLKSGEVREE